MSTPPLIKTKLFISANNLDFEDLARRIPLQPSRLRDTTHRVFAPTLLESGIPLKSWIYIKEFTELYEIEESIASFLDGLDEVLPLIRNYVQTHDAKLGFVVSVTLKEEAGAIYELSPHMMKRLSDLDLTFVLDIYDYR